MLLSLSCHLGVPNICTSLGFYHTDTHSFWYLVSCSRSTQSVRDSFERASPASVRRDTEWVFPQEWRVSNLHTSWQNRLWKRFYYFHSKKQLRRNAHRCFIGSMNFLPDCKAKQSLLLAIICNCPATVLAMQGNLKEQLTKHLSQTTLSLCDASCASPTTAAASSDSDRPRRWSEAARARPQSKTIMWHVRRATVKWLESTVQTAHTDHSEVVINGSQM